MSVITIYEAPSKQLVLQALSDALTGDGEHGFKYLRDGDNQTWSIQVTPQEFNQVRLKVAASRETLETGDAESFQSFSLHRDVATQINQLLTRAGIPSSYRFDIGTLDDPSSSVHAEVNLPVALMEKFKQQLDKEIRDLSTGGRSQGAYTQKELARAQEADAHGLGGGVAF